MYQSRSNLVLADIWAGRSSTDYSLQTSPPNCQGGQILRCLLLSEFQIRFVIIIGNASWRGSMEMWCGQERGSFSFYICMINIWELMGLPQSYMWTYFSSILKIHSSAKIIFFSTFASAGLDLILHFIICLGQWPCCCCRFYWVRREASSHPDLLSIPSMDSGTSSRCIFFFRFGSISTTDLILFSLPHILVLSSPSHLQHGLSYRQI